MGQRLKIKFTTEKQIESIDDIPEELLDYYEIDQEELEDESITWEEIEDDLVHLIKDSVGYGKEPKRKGEWYYYKFKMKFGKVTVTAMTKRYIKDYPDVICDEEVHGIFIKRNIL